MLSNILADFSFLFSLPDGSNVPLLVVTFVAEVTPSKFFLPPRRLPVDFG